jgi:hypothetical protein
MGYPLGILLLLFAVTPLISHTAPQEGPESFVAVYLNDDLILDVSHMTAAEVRASNELAINELAMGSGSHWVVVVLTLEGRERLRESTGANVGERLSAVVDGETVYEPIILNALDLKRIPLVEDLGLKEADELARRINEAIARDG